ncbi:MAG: dihydropteroate synthase [Dehalococcoidia bacterium]|nr:dihydropteroate synthase [Dehalococcoidia bacterium]
MELQPLTIRGRRFEWGSRTYLMAILNVTPDSFSGDGIAYDVDAALAQARRFEEEGADVIDVGGESTRPGYEGVSADEEMRRVLPVVERASAAVALPISIDTTKAAVAEAALAAGAHLINDVSGLQADPAMAGLAARAGVPIVIMHNQRGKPFHDVIGDILDGLNAGIAVAEAAGVPREKIIIDPGFGFGWTVEQNLEMLRRLRELKALGLPLLAGTSRKSTIGAVLDLPVEERLLGTAATVALSIANGADMVRVHDVREMVQVCRMTDAVVRGWQAP